MAYKQNLHTHSVFTDGKNTIEELVLEAIDKNFDSLGFSEHSQLVYSSIIPDKMNPTEAARYRTEVRSLKEQYRDRLEIFCGLELDFYSDVSLDDYDYFIGSVHCLDVDGGIYPFDRGLVETRKYIDDHFGGSSLAFAERYYHTVARLPEKGKIDILGHFDLVSKNNEHGELFDPMDPRYLEMGMETIRSLQGKIPLFEVNTGAISRGYRSAPYPQMDFLKEFHRLGFGAVITSDCHNKDHLDCWFDEAAALLKEAGFRTKWVYTADGFKEVCL